MPDFVRSREWTKPPGDPAVIVRALEDERQSLECWRDLLPDYLDVTLVDGASASFSQVEDLLAWLGRHSGVDARGVFVRWTEEGRSASPEMARIALRIGRPTTLWVGCAEESRAVGAFELILAAIEAKTRNVDTQAPQRAAVPLAPSVRTAEIADQQLGVGVAGEGSSPASRDIMSNPWVVGVGTAVISGAILLVLAAMLP